MQYIGLQTQIRRNNFKSILLLLAFPSLILILSWFFFFFIYDVNLENINQINESFLKTIPWTTGIVLIWFFIAYFFNTRMIARATGAFPLERQKNKRIYNLVENLCISQGMTNPKINLIEDSSLNAFASGINEKTYTISLSQGIINKLNDQELEAVIAHELTHIKNRDVRLLIISIVFVGIFSFISEAAFRMLRGSSRNTENRTKNKNSNILFLVLILAFIGYLLSLVFRFALSRKREFLADAGSSEITHNPNALASALEKISTDSRIEAVTRRDVAQLFIDNPQEKKSGFFSSLGILFATHPPIEERINLLKNF